MAFYGKIKHNKKSIFNIPILRYELSRMYEQESKFKAQCYDDACMPQGAAALGHNASKKLKYTIVRSK